MSGYGDMARDEQQAAFVNEWAPLNDPHLAEQFGKNKKDFREQYRFTLARARAAEAKLAQHRSAFKALCAVLREVT